MGGERSLGLVTKLNIWRQGGEELSSSRCSFMREIRTQAGDAKETQHNAGFSGDSGTVVGSWRTENLLIPPTALVPSLQRSSCRLSNKVAAALRFEGGRALLQGTATPRIPTVSFFGLVLPLSGGPPSDQPLGTDRICASSTHFLAASFPVPFPPLPKAGPPSAPRRRGRRSRRARGARLSPRGARRPAAGGPAGVFARGDGVRTSPSAGAGPPAGEQRIGKSESQVQKPRKAADPSNTVRAGRRRTCHRSG